MRHSVFYGPPLIVALTLSMVVAVLRAGSESAAVTALAAISVGATTYASIVIARLGVTAGAFRATVFSVFSGALTCGGISFIAYLAYGSSTFGVPDIHGGITGAALNSIFPAMFGACVGGIAGIGTCAVWRARQRRDSN